MKIFEINQTKINKLKREKIRRISTIKSTNSHIFYWTTKDIDDKNIIKLQDLIKENGYKLTSGVNIIIDQDNF